MRNGIYVSWNVGENRASYLHVVYHMAGAIDRSSSYTSYSRFRLLATSRNVLHAGEYQDSLCRMTRSGDASGFDVP